MATKQKDGASPLVWVTADVALNPAHVVSAKLVGGTRVQLSMTGTDEPHDLVVDGLTTEGRMLLVPEEMWTQAEKDRGPRFRSL